MLYDSQNANMDDEAYSSQYEQTQPVQTQQVTESQQIVSVRWDDDYWGVLRPMHHSMSPIKFRKDKPKYKVGRSSDNDSVVSHLKISNKHCIIEWNGVVEKGTVRVQDLSSNGTFIEGAKVGKNSYKILQDGAEIAFGQWSDENTDDNFRYTFRYIANGIPTEGLHAFYDLMHELGRGSFASVKMAMSRANGLPYAVKLIDRKKMKLDGDGTKTVFIREIAILDKLKHPNICQLIESFQTEKEIALVLEYVDGGDMLDYIISHEGLEESVAQRFTYQLMKALKYIHDRGVAHRDLKPENILLTKDTPPMVKIADFGLAKAVDSISKFKTTCGTPVYLAPEVILRNSDDAYSSVVDSWSVGVIIFSMICNSNPFLDDDNSQMAIRFRSRYVDWNMLTSKGVSDDCLQFIRGLIEENPADRMTSTEALKHPWIAHLADADPEFSESQIDTVGSFVSHKATAGSFDELSQGTEVAVAPTPRPKANVPLPAPAPDPAPAPAPVSVAAPPLSAPPIDAQPGVRTDISCEFEHIQMEDGTVSPAGSTSATLTPHEYIPLPPATGQGVGIGRSRRLERHPMEVAECDEDGEMLSFNPFYPGTIPSPAGPSMKNGNENENRNGNTDKNRSGNARNLKRKERSNSLMEEDFETARRAAPSRSAGEADDSSEEDALTPISEGQEALPTPSNGRTRNGRQKNGAPAPFPVPQAQLQGKPSKRTRATGPAYDA